MEGEGGPQFILLVIAPGLEGDDDGRGRWEAQFVFELEKERGLAGAPLTLDGEGDGSLGFGSLEEGGDGAHVGPEAEQVIGGGFVGDRISAD
jgi:hypothetical protein